MRNPALMNWRSAAALSLAALGRRADARGLCAEELRLARRPGRVGRLVTSRLRPGCRHLAGMSASAGSRTSPTSR
jgi:hypothetical protein